MRSFIYGIVIPVAFLSVAACSGRHDNLSADRPEEPVADTDSPIVIDADIPGSKAVDPLTTSTLESFDVSAIWNYDGTSTNKWYLKQQAVTKPTTVWTTTPPSYWTLTGNLSFFMYAPSSTSVPGLEAVFTTTGMPGVRYTPSVTNIESQADLCLARPVLNSTKQIGPVPAEFHHTLTQIWFDVNYEGTPPGSFSILVENIRLRNIVGTNTATFTTTDPYFEWDAVGAADCTYELKLSSSHLRNEYLPEKPAAGIPVQNTLGRLYLLPQTLDPSADIQVTYSFFDTSRTPAVRQATFTKTVSIPSPSVWPANRSIHYKLTINVGESSPIVLDGYTIDDWTESGNNHSEIEFD
ncbi:MAG: fimbrillin family protein [Bacteroidales bacterium]|nr:fimbrillin family protein [Bacteroidales bacterium]